MDSLQYGLLMIIASYPDGYYWIPAIFRVNAGAPGPKEDAAYLGVAVSNMQTSTTSLVERYEPCCRLLLC